MCTALAPIELYNPKLGIIYTETQVDIGKVVYVGLTIQDLTSDNTNARHRQHIRDGKRKRSKATPFDRVVAENPANMTFKAICILPAHLLPNAEKYFIAKYNTYIHSPGSVGYNLTLGGETVPEELHTPEAKAKSRKALEEKYGSVTGPMRTPEARAKARKTLKEKYGSVTGLMRTPEAQAKARKTLKEKYGSVAGKIHTPEVQAKARKTLKEKYGRVAGQMHTPEARAKACKTREDNARPILVVYKSGKTVIYKSTSKLSRDLGYAPSNNGRTMSLILHNKRSIPCRLREDYGVVSISYGDAG